MKYVASCSFGKDSCAMVLKIIENKYPLDEVIFYDTGMGFDAIYKVKNFVNENYLKPNNIKLTTLTPKVPFLYKMFEKEVNGKNGKHYGYSWCGGRCRWGTTEKLKAIEKYCKGSVEYVGIAYDEQNRIIKERKGNKVFPLNELKMTEKDCLSYCRKMGIKWMEDDIDLYDILDRVSCWCCTNKNLKELKNYWLYLPKYWQKLKELQVRTDRPFKKDKTIFDLEVKFKDKQNEQNTII